MWEVLNSAKIFWEWVDSVRHYVETVKVNFVLSKLKLLRIQLNSRITNEWEKISPSFTSVFCQVFIMV